jgi:hypothetical protein
MNQEEEEEEEDDDDDENCNDNECIFLLTKDERFRN